LRKNLRGLLVEQQVVIPEMRTRHMPMEVLRLDVQGEKIGQQRGQRSRKVARRVGRQICRRAERRCPAGFEIDVVHGTCLLCGCATIGISCEGRNPGGDPPAHASFQRYRIDHLYRLGVTPTNSRKRRAQWL
jgi:hypothetical protein